MKTQESSQVNNSTEETTNATIRNINKQVYKDFKSLAAQKELKLPEMLQELMRVYHESNSQDIR